MTEQVRSSGGRIDRVYYCPHRPEENCECRKPKPGLLLQAARDFQIGLERSYVIGDAASDIDAARAAGWVPILVQAGRGEERLPLFQSRQVNRYHITSQRILGKRRVGF